MALWGGRSGGRGVFLVVARRGMFVVGVEGAATLEVAAWRCARLWFCDSGVLNCVRLGLFRLRAGLGFEHDGAAEV